MGPLVSVFLFSKDRAGTIRRSIESVLGQTYRNIEYIIQDGASTDGTLEVIREFDDPRIRLVSEPDSGPMDGYFLALRRCRGEYVCACLSDEELLPTAVEEAIAALEADPDAAALYRDVLTTDIHGAVIGETIGQPFDLAAYMAGRFCPQFPSAMFRRRFIEAAGLHTRQWDLECGEFEFWCRLALTGPLRYLPGHAAKFAFHDRQGGRDPRNAAVLARGRRRIVDVMAAETGMFAENPDLQRACRTGNALLFARHLLSLGADDEAVALYADVADESRRFELRAAPHETTAAHLSAARSQRLSGHGRLSLQILEVATHVRVDSAVAFELAQTLTALGRTHQAMAALDMAIGLDPEFREAHWERGALLERRGDIDEALAAWRRADVFRDPVRHSLYLVAILKSPQATNRSVLAAARDWARRHALPPDACGPARFEAWTPGERINLGYSCSFWNAEVMNFQIFPFLRRHDRQRFKVTAYVRGIPGPTLPGIVDEIRLVGDLSDEEFVRRVRADGMHVLVELNGHSPGHQFAAMGARCAPVQVSYFNNIGTSGVEQVDYILADGISIPPDKEPFYVEQVYRLPRCFFCATYNPSDLPPVAAPPSVRNGYVTFGCFSSAAKINPELVGIWARMLHRVPGSRFFVRNGDLTPPDNRDALARQFERQGIDRARLRILPGTSRQGVLESYAEVDVALDTHPYCGGNTSAEALWQGVPVISLIGDRYASAYGAAVLVASGLEELVARTPEEYVDLAARLAGDRSRLAFYRQHLRRMVVEHGFSDAVSFTASMDAAYVDMLTRWSARVDRERVSEKSTYAK